LKDGNENSSDYRRDVYCYISSKGSSGYFAFKNQNAGMVYEMVEIYTDRNFISVTCARNSAVR